MPRGKRPLDAATAAASAAAASAAVQVVAATQRRKAEPKTEKTPPVVEKPSEPKQERKERSERNDRSERHESGFAQPELVGGAEGTGGKKKRRRNRRRGGNDAAAPSQVPADVTIDKDQLEKCAWKIYLAEVSEEGLALMDDRTGIEAARRSFRMAEIFLIEAARSKNPAPARRNDTSAEDQGAVAAEDASSED